MRPSPGAPRSSIRPEFFLIGASVLSAALLTWSGLRAARADASRSLELTRARATIDAFTSLRRRYEPAVATESIAWRRTWLQLRELGVSGDERLAVTERVARAAETAGLRDVRVDISDSDTTGQQARLPTGGVQSTPAPFSLLVECRGGLASVIAFLGQLPPSVAPTAVSLVRQDGRASHRILLAVYELTFSNGAPLGWPSAERGSVGGSGVDRPDG